mmetsp:Transcript_17541/g.24179  ORF Transcript_17541/g.24179 Transcript_17541/m.24179 type:complete len:230 (-) Transcript_17541:16-705(-)
MSSVNPPKLPDPEDASTGDLMVMTGSIFALVVFLILLRYAFIIVLDVCYEPATEQPWQAFLRRYCLCSRRENIREEQDIEFEANSRIRNDTSQSIALSIACLSVEERNALLDVITPKKVITEDMVSTREVQSSNEEVSFKDEQCVATHTKDEKLTHDVEKCESDSTCVICLSPYEVGDNIVTTRNCSHVFHRECISQWLQKSVECPYCRTELVSKEEMLDILVKFDSDD